MQLLYAIPKSWKEDISKVKENIHIKIILSKEVPAIAILTGKKISYWYALSQKTAHSVLFSLNY